MGRLFQFFYKYRAFFTFISLEIVCAWLIVQNNQYQSSKYFNTSNEWVATVMTTSNNVKEYFSLREINNELAEENAALKRIIDQQKRTMLEAKLLLIDSAKLTAFTYASAKVINNSVSSAKNYITINKGAEDGILPGMAVISAKGVVGKVKTASKHFSVLISVLNVTEQVSSLIKRGNYLCTSQWDGVDPLLIDLKYVPRHVKLNVGDTIITSGFNAVFPEGVPIGVVSSFELKNEALFYDVKVKLAQDFSQLTYVDVIKSIQKAERDSIEVITKSK